MNFNIEIVTNNIKCTKNAIECKNCFICKFFNCMNVFHFFRENLVLNISSLWEGYPHNEMTFMFKFFFIIQMSYWLHCYPELYFQRTKREEMSARIQYASVGLLYVAAGYLLK